MTVTPSNLVSEEVLATVTDLWTPASILKPTWLNPIALSSSWTTAISRMQNDVQQRRGLVGKPQRSLTLPFWSEVAADTVRLHSAMRRIGKARFLMPLSCDISLTTSSSSSTTINCDTTYRRFFANGYVAIGDFDWTSHQFGDFEIVQVDYITGTTLELESSLSTTYAQGSVVVPLLECYLSRDASMVAQTDTATVLEVGGLEVVGPPAMDATFAPGTTVPGAYTYGGFPIWRPNINWRQAVQIETLRSGRESSQGIEQVVSVDGTWPQTSISFLLTHTTREEAWETIQFFDSRAGSLYPFWVADPVTTFVYSNHLGSQLIVESNGPELDWQFRPYLAIEFSDGSIAVRQVDSVVRVSTLDYITLDDTLSSQPITRISPAYLCRFESDELTENWYTATVMEASITVQEVGDESDVVLAGISRIDTNPGNFAFTDDGCPAWVLLEDCEDVEADIITSNDNITLPVGYNTTGDIIGKFVKLSSGGAGVDVCYQVSASSTEGSATVTVSDVYNTCGECLGLYIAEDCEGVEADITLDESTTDLTAVAASSLADLVGEDGALGTDAVTFSSGGAGTDVCYRIRAFQPGDSETPTTAVVSYQYENCQDCLFKYVAYSCETPGLRFSFSRFTATITAVGYSSMDDIPLLKIINVDNTFDGTITPGCYILREWTESDSPTMSSPDITAVHDHCGLCLEWVVAEDCRGEVADQIITGEFGVSAYVGDGSAHTISSDGFSRCWSFRQWVESDGDQPIAVLLGNNYSDCQDCIDTENPPGDDDGPYGPVPCSCPDQYSPPIPYSRLRVAGHTPPTAELFEIPGTGFCPNFTTTTGDAWDGTLLATASDCVFRADNGDHVDDVKIYQSGSYNHRPSVQLDTSASPTCYWRFYIDRVQGSGPGGLNVATYTKSIGTGPTGTYTLTTSSCGFVGPATIEIVWG